DHDLAPSVVPRAAAALDVGGDGFLQVVAAREREPAVRIVRPDRCPGRLDRLRRRRDVGVEVLEPEDVGIVAGRGGDAVDVEPRDVLEPPDAHCPVAAGRVFHHSRKSVQRPSASSVTRKMPSISVVPAGSMRIDAHHRAIPRPSGVIASGSWPKWTSSWSESACSVAARIPAWPRIGSEYGPQW